MPVFNPQRANLLTTAGEAVPRLGTIALQGAIQQIDIQKQLDEIKHLREIRPYEVASARLAAEDIKLRVERFKILNNQYLLKVQADTMMQAELGKLQASMDLNRKMKAERYYNENYANDVMTKAGNGDVEGLAELNAKILSDPNILYSDIMPLEASPLNAQKLMPEIARKKFETIAVEKQIEYSHKTDQAIEQMKRLDREARMLREKQEEMMELEEIVGPVSELGAFGEKGSNAVKLNRGVQSLITHIQSRLALDPANAEKYEDDIKMLEWLAKIATTPERRSLFRTIMGKRIFAGKQYKRAQIAANTIGTFAKEIDSTDPKRREAGIKGMQKFMKELMRRTTEEQVEDPISDRLKEIQKLQRNIERDYMLSQNPFAAPQTPQTEKKMDAAKVIAAYKAAYPNATEEEIITSAKANGHL